MYSNCLFAGNSAGYGGALSAYAGNSNNYLEMINQASDVKPDVIFDNVNIQENYAKPYEPNAGYFRYSSLKGVR